MKGYYKEGGRKERLYQGRAALQSELAETLNFLMQVSYYSDSYPSASAVCSAFLVWPAMASWLVEPLLCLSLCPLQFLSHGNQGKYAET